MNVRPIQTRIFREGEDLESFILEHVPKLQDGTVLTVTSKIVALAEERTAIAENPQEKNQIIEKESEWMLPTKYVPLTIKDGMLAAAAGIDESNADGKLILMPKDSFAAAARVRRTLIKSYQIKHLGVLITDSRTLPLRAGAVGLAVGYSGFRGLKEYRGTSDLFGRALRVTRSNVADGLAAAAVLVMGEGAERQPLAILEDAPVSFCQRIDRRELIVAMRDDLYAPLFQSAGVKIKKRRKH